MNHQFFMTLELLKERYYRQPEYNLFYLTKGSNLDQFTTYIIDELKMMRSRLEVNNN